MHLLSPVGSSGCSRRGNPSHGKWQALGALVLLLLGCQSGSPGELSDEEKAGRIQGPLLPEQLIRRLNRTEYLNTVRELLGPTATTEQVLLAGKAGGKLPPGATSSTRTTAT